MLKRTHVEPFTRVEAGAIAVDFLAPDDQVIAFLDRLCRLVRRLEGRDRRAVREALRRQQRRVRDARRLEGVAKSLVDVCRFARPPGAEQAPAVREALFRARGRRWPPLPGDSDAPYEEAASALGLGVDDVRRLLYADRASARVLDRVPRIDGGRLLERYNLDLARGVLLDSTRVTITATGGWRAIFRAVKLARLMYRIERDGARRYRIELTGPAAPFIQRTQRYGRRFARVVPALVRAPGWALHADIVRGDRVLDYELDHSAPLGRRRRRGRPPRYDSAWEQDLARAFREKIGEARGGWTLHREDTVVALGEELFLPDFTLRHRDGREALVEIVGFWAPGYLEAKVRKIRAAGLDNLILVVYKALAAGELAAATEGPVIWFHEKPRIGPVMEAAERVARPPG